ncbi:23S rRNA (adenine(2503)-C(2))-methyltransferase RlmN [Desulfosarcina sp. OttesenSCG-928-A07]|nr:23S rRNA (adenine(2503)-C(2))-methyltransferase RlmN [Desulfosarcina sp. OttesenSCG-928-G17]MDL2329298.1 23S rRNA (adenine(2503)-C(2))-methyltransferase RlmN [Desulfosarcina sp. OttesenSCG-928-A07]
MHILDQTHAEFVDAFFRYFGKGPHYSTPVYRQVMKTGSLDMEALPVFSEAGGLSPQVEEKICVDAGEIVQSITENGVTKFVTRLTDGMAVESVVIPMLRPFPGSMSRRVTVCVSSQVGCRMGCRFCRTGKMGFFRNLTPAEIVGQVFSARHHFGEPVRNVVFMGMGEPLDNLENVCQAIRVMTDQRGLDIAGRRITVSTAGLADEIHSLARMDDIPVNLAVSLNAPDDVIRSRLMPVNNRFSMATLRESLFSYQQIRKKTAVFVEYVLIRGVNDEKFHAHALSRYLAPLDAKVNLIPYNPGPAADFSAPSEAVCENFRHWLVAQGVFVRKREEKGSSIMAACGQLGSGKHFY